MQDEKLQPMIKGMTIIYFGVGFIMLMFAVVVLFLVITESVPADPEAFPNWLGYGLFVMLLAAMLGGNQVFKNQLSSIDPDNTLRGKVNQYQGFMLIRVMPLEAVGLGGSVFALLTGNLFTLLVPVLAGGIFILWRPTVESIADDLRLSDQERAALTDQGQGQD